MKDLNKEQLLFILTVVILGTMVYFGLDGRYVSKRIRTSSKAMEVRELPPCADIQFPGKQDPFYSKEGRNVFAPPRDWLPLESLVLDSPPQDELLAVAPFTEPGLGESFFSTYLYQPKAPEPAADESDEGYLMDEGGAEEEAGDASPGIEIDLAGEALEEDPETALLARYDWIRLSGQTSRIFGHILNDNKFDLLDNREAIRFELVAKGTGKTMGVHDYPRDRFERFGFADTVMNAIELEIRKLSFNAGNLGNIHEKAEWCLALSKEEPRAIERATYLVKRAIEIDPLSRESYSLLACIYEAAFDYENALKVLRSAIDRQLNAPSVYVHYGRLLNRYGMDDASMEAYETAENIKPRFAPALVARAELAFDHGDYADALSLFEEAWTSPSWKAELKMEAILGEARCLLALNRLDEAATKVQRAINLDEEEGEAQNLKGAIALARGDIPAAEAAFQRATELDPNHSLATRNMGVTLFRKGDLEGAAKKFEEAIDLDPFNSCRPMAARGFVNECLGQDDTAAASYETAVQINPMDFYALYLWGRNLRRSGDMTTAVDTLKRALQLNDKMVDILGELGHACLLAGLYEDASFYFDEYLKRGEADDRLLYLFGLALLNESKLESALEQFDAAIAIDEEAPEPYNGKAYALYTLGRVEECLDAFAQVVRLFDETSTDLRYLYARKWMARIDTHRRKSQWLDSFQRREIQNKWRLMQRAGPTVKLINNEVVIQGTQRQEQPNERTSLRREIPGREFRLFEADVTMGQESQGRMGVVLGLYISRGVQDALSKAEVALAVEPNGNLVYNVVDKGKPSVDWEKISMDKIQAGESVRMGIEVVDYNAGLIHLTLDGKQVLPEPIEVKSLKKCSRPLLTGIFTEAAGSRNVHVTADNVRIIVQH